MKIIAEVERIEDGLYRFNGKDFDSFLIARREMSQWMKRRRQGLSPESHEDPEVFISPAVRAASGG